MRAARSVCRHINTTERRLSIRRPQRSDSGGNVYTRDFPSNANKSEIKKNFEKYYTYKNTGFFPSEFKAYDIPAKHAEKSYEKGFVDHLGPVYFNQINTCRWEKRYLGSI